MTGSEGTPMAVDANEELYRLLLETANEAPLEVIANCVEVMATVLNRRLQDQATPADPNGVYCAGGCGPELLGRPRRFCPKCRPPRLLE